MGQIRIIPEEELLGVTWWRMILPGPPDTIQLYRYIGRSKSPALYWFERRDGGIRISFFWDQLYSDMFGPFLLDLDKMEKAFQEVS